MAFVWECIEPVFILGIDRGNIPFPLKKESYIPPKNLSIFFVFGPRIIHCYKKLTIKLLFNFNNFNSRLPASSQHHIKYINPKKAHPCVIPRILSHHASKSGSKCLISARASEKNRETKSFQLLRGFARRPPDQGPAPGPAEGTAPRPPISPPKLTVSPQTRGV